MKAQTLAISLPNEGCDKNCPYCISKMTGYVKSSPWFYANINKALTLAHAASVTDVVITGKGEPCVSWHALCRTLDRFRDFPLVLQTNGLELNKHSGEKEYLIELAKSGLNVLAVSIDDYSQISRYKKLWEEASKLGLTLRITVNLTNKTMKKSFDWYLKECKKFGIHQLSFREVTIPNHGIVDTDESCRAVSWIENNVHIDVLVDWRTDFKEELSRHRVIRTLPYGAKLYDCNGIGVTYFDYCIQDEAGEDDIRSLIYQENGHMYTSWNSEASRIF